MYLANDEDVITYVKHAAVYVTNDSHNDICSALRVATQELENSVLY